MNLYFFDESEGVLTDLVSGLAYDVSNAATRRAIRQRAAEYQRTNVLPKVAKILATDFYTVSQLTDEYARVNL